MSRCYICDYTPEEGSDYADLAPGRFKLHHLPNGEILCSECLNVSDECLEDMEYNDEEDV